MIWSFGALQLFGRFGANYALYAFIAWVFMRGIEQTAPYAPVALVLSLGFLVPAVYRMRTAITVASRGVPAEGTLYGFDAYFTNAPEGQKYNRIRRLNFSYEFEGQQYKGQSTWRPNGANEDLPLYSKIPLVVDPLNPQRAYWVLELPELFKKT